jgi:hypothetical protein
MSAHKIFLDGEEFICHGYLKSGDPIQVDIERVQNGGIITTDGCVLSLRPDHDDDFYAVVSD